MADIAARADGLAVRIRAAQARYEAAASALDAWAAGHGGSCTGSRQAPEPGAGSCVRVSWSPSPAPASADPATTEVAFDVLGLVPGLGGVGAGLRRLGGSLGGTTGARVGADVIAPLKALDAVPEPPLAPVTILPNSGRLHVVTGRGAVYEIPPGWTQRMADNDAGLVFQRPGAAGNQDMIRIMEPTPRYPEGYVRVYNGSGQPVTPLGKPGSKADTHIPQDYRGSTGAHEVDPEAADESLAPVLTLLHRQVLAAVARADGGLDLRFGGDVTLEADPSPDYEAWHLVAPDGFRVVSMPGGRLAVWRPPGTRSS